MTPLEALKPFADALDEWGDDESTVDRADIWEHPLGMCITVGDFRRAAAVYAGSKPNGEDAVQHAASCEAREPDHVQNPIGESP